MPINKSSKIWVGESNSDQYLNSKSSIPQVSALMANKVSQTRREILGDEVEQGVFRDGSVSQNNKNILTTNSHALSSVGLKKQAQAVSSSGGGFRGGTGDTVKQSPEVYSPLWLNSNLNLPRDRATINAWCRSFYALNPFVHNAINLHSTYPISKLNIKCHNKDIEKFFNDMIEEIDLMNICVQIAQEYWLLGESFVYGELDQSQGKWSRLLIQNPDYMVVKRTIATDNPVIMIRPDENLKKIVFSNKPSDIEQRKQLNQYIIDSVKRGENIPVDNFHISHLARRISPYEIRGTGLPVCIFRQLMLFDKLRECYDDQTEVLTDQGFKKITDFIYKTTDIAPNSNYVNGVELDETGQVSSIITLKENFKIACVNPENNNVEYHKPTEFHMSAYQGKMLHFSGKKVDCMVTPNHKMWVKPIINNIEKEYQKIPAKQLSKGTIYKFQNTVNWVGDNIDSVMVLNKTVPIDVYLTFIGHVISEGCVDTSLNKKTNQYRNRTIITQLTQSSYYLKMKSNLEKFGKYLNKNISTTIKMSGAGFSQHCPKEQWSGTICSKKLNKYLINELGTDGKCDSKNKKIPHWILSLDKKYLEILLSSLLDGDGSRINLMHDKKRFRYSTASKQLADDVYELSYKLGYAPILQSFKRKTCTEYVIRWSETNKGKAPQIYGGEGQKCASFKEVDYNGAVWCFEVPTGLFITRRNGKITIQGNSKYAQADNMINPLTLIKVGSADFKPTFADLEAFRNIFEEAQYDKDFKIFTHEGVDVSRVGYGQGIYDISGDITQIIKEIYVGLQVPPVLMDGGADTTYANGGVALDVLRQRYMQFRNMLSAWLKRKIFAPISKIQEFYEYKDGVKQLIVPDIDWNHMSIFDAGDYINTLVTLTQGQDDQKRASLHSLYRSMGLEYEDEIRRIRKEAIQNAIAKKEKSSLESMDLNSLRTLNEEDEIPEQTDGEKKDSSVPGEISGGSENSLPGLDLGAPPSGGAPGGPPPPSAPLPT